jgi:hypothetical protein
MKVVALGKISQNKFCNLSPGTVFSLMDSDMTVHPEIYIKVEADINKSQSILAVELTTGRTIGILQFHTSTRCKIYQDACVVLDPIDRD